MKKLITLMFALLAIATGAQAMSYNIWIAGIQVTDDNKNNVTGGGISWSSFPDGKVWFDPGHNTLYLENVRINGYSREAIKSDIYGLTIKVKGRYNSLTSSGSYGIYQSSNGTLTFEGDGVLDILADKSGIYINNAYCDLSLKDDVRVVVTCYNGTAVGVYGSTAVTGYCYIEGEKTMLLAETKACEKTVEGFKDMILSDGICFNKPYTYYYGSYYDKDRRCVCMGGDPVGNEDGAVVIGKHFDITPANFPDAQMLERVRTIDKDGNNILDRDENYNARSFYLTTDNPQYSKNPDLTGLELLYDITTFEANLLEVESIEFHNSFLEAIYLQNGKITDLVVDECPWLRSLWCHGHNLTYLDLSNNTHLSSLSAGRNQLINVKLPSSFPDEAVGLSIECNKFTESRMNTLINGLPQNTSGKEYTLNVTTSIGKEYFTNTEFYKPEGNVITQAQLQTIRDKGWTPTFTQYHMGEWTRSEYYGTLFYDVFVGNKKVSDANKNDIMEDYGGMSYNHDTNTLSIMMDYTLSGKGIMNYIPGLTIKTADVSTLDTQDDAISIYTKTTITGNYPLNLNSKNGRGIFVAKDRTLTIDNGKLNIKTKDASCILGATTDGEQQLIINNSEVHAECNEPTAAISCFPNGISFDGCGITEPVGGRVKDGDIVDGDGNKASNVTIAKASTLYPVYVAGKQVHSLNASDVLGDGTVSYNSDTKTLTLKNATINTDDESGIEFRDFGLNLELIGENHVHSVDGYPVYVGYDMRMVGDGSLEAVSDNNNAIYLYWGGLAVKENVKLTARGGKCGISGYATPYGNVGELHVLSSGAVVKASGPEGSIVALASLQLAEGVAIDSPQGATFNETTGNVELDGVTVTDEVVIAGAAYQFVIYDGMTDMTEARRLLYMAVDFGILGMSYNALTSELSFETMNNGKQMVVQAPYNHHGDNAYFLSNRLTTDDRIEIAITDDQRTWYQGVVDAMDDAEAKAYYTNLLNSYGRVVISFEIPEEWPTENIVGNVVHNEELSEEVSWYCVALVLCGAISMEDQHLYDSDGRLLFSYDENGLVSLGDDVNNGDCVYRRIVQADRMKGITSIVNSVRLNFIRGGATDIASPEVPYDAEQQRIFNLSGQRVEGQPTHKGIYIINGKKVVVK